MGRKYPGVATGLLIFLATPIVGAAYLQEGVTSDRQGVQEGFGPREPELAFVSQLPGSLAPYSTPLILNGRAYVATMDLDYEGLDAAGVFEVNLENAEFRLVLPLIDTGRRAFPIASDGQRIFAGDGRGVVSLDLLTDEMTRWSPRPNVAFADDWYYQCQFPAIREGTLFVSCLLTPNAERLRGELHFHVIAALDPRSLQPIWQQFLSKTEEATEQEDLAVMPQDSTRSPVDGLAVTDDRVYAVIFGAHQVSVVALNRTNGRIDWQEGFTPHVNRVRCVPRIPENADAASNCTPGYAAMPAANDSAVVVKFDRDLRIFDAAGGAPRLIAINTEVAGLDKGGALLWEADSIVVPTVDQLSRVDLLSETIVDLMLLQSGEVWSRAPLIAAGPLLYGLAQPHSGVRVEALGVDGRFALYAISRNDLDKVWDHELTPGVELRPPSSGLPSYPRLLPPQHYDNAYRFAVADGAAVTAGVDGTVTVLGRTAASIQPDLRIEPEFPMVGEPIVVDVSQSGPGVYGNATRFRVEWGDGSVDEWQNNARFVHTYHEIGSYPARFFLENEAGQSAIEPRTFHVSVPARQLQTGQAPVALVADDDHLTSARDGFRFLSPVSALLAVVVAGLLVAAFLAGRLTLAAKSTAPERFTVERELGRGGHGRTLLATDNVLRRRVVLKRPVGAWTVDAGARRKYLREAQVAAQVQHPNVVSILDVLPDVNEPTVVMEYVEGGNLSQYAKRPLAPHDALRIVRDVLTGLQEVHRHGIIHRDLKPANILMTRDGRAKITDFGLATTVAEDERTLNSEGSGSGTIAYMCPEQVRGALPTPSWDLYAAAAILYELLIGKHYLGSLEGPAYRTMRRIVEDEPDFVPSRLPKSLVPWLRKGLAKDPTKRHPNATDMLAALIRATSEEPGLELRRAARA